MSNTSLGLVRQILKEQFGVDQKRRNAWSDYGYPKITTFMMHYTMYRRFGLAKAGIQMYPDKCWSVKPTIHQGKDITEAENRIDRTPQEAAFDEFANRVSLWDKMKAVDTRQRVYQYGALIIMTQAVDGASTEFGEPLETVSLDDITGLRAVYQEQMIPTKWEQDRNNARYGLPTKYQYRQELIQDESRQEYEITNKNNYIDVHWTRVITFAEGDPNDNIEGEPANEAGFNSLITLERIIGAGGEGFWKNAVMKTVYSNTDKDAPVPTQDEINEFSKSMQDFVENMDKFLMMNGMQADVLSADLPNPQEFFDVALSDYAASVKIPHKILVGAQTGRLAADEDGSFFLQNAQERSENWCTTMVNKLVDWLNEHTNLGMLDYIVEWPDLLEPTKGEKLDVAAKMADINEKLFRTTGEIGFTASEIRMIGGYGQLTEADMPDILDDDEEISEGDEDE